MVMPASLLDTILDGPFALTPRPEPLPGDLRLSWGIALVVLMLGASRGTRASLQKLHFLAHSIRTRETRLEIQQVFARSRRSSDILVRVEPWLNRALAFAKGAKLIEMEGGRSAVLAERGRRMLDALHKDGAILSEEKRFLQDIRKHATETNIEKIMRMELF
jgi:hypothetical protein